MQWGFVVICGVQSLLLRPVSWLQKRLDPAARGRDSGAGRRVFPGDENDV